MNFPTHAGNHQEGMSHPRRPGEPPGAAAGLSLFIRDTAISLLVLGLFFSASRWFLVLPCVAVAAAAIAMAWPISAHLLQGATFRRRLLAASIAADGSFYQRWLNRHFLASLVAGILGLLAGTLLLALGRTMAPQYWVVLAADALLLPLLAWVVRGLLASQIKAGTLASISRQWPVATLNTVLVTAAFAAVTFFTGTPDTRDQQLADVFPGGIAAFANHAACAPAGYLCGLLEGIDRSAWHLRQILVPLLPAGSLRHAGWAVALLAGGGLGAGITWLLLGATTLSSPIERGNCNGRAAALAILATFIGAAIVVPLPAGRPAAATAARPAPNDPCSGRSELAAAEQARLANGLSETANAAAAAARSLIQSATGTLVRSAEGKVDNYLDWYYSLEGANTRLAMAASGQLAGFMHRQLMSALFPGGLEGPLAALAQQAANGSSAHFERFGKQSTARLRATVLAEPCLRRIVEASRIGNFETDLLRTTGALTVGATAAGATWRAAAGRAGTRIAAASAVRAGGRALAAQAGKSAASRAAGTLGVAAACGPLAVLCAATVGAASWLATDYLLIKADEMMHRDEHKCELLAALAALEAEMSAGLIAAQAQLIDQLAANARSAGEQLFVPARDGV